LLIVVDTNVIVSGLINPHGAPGRVVDLILSNAVQLAFDDRVMAEYEEVLTREPFSFPRRQVAALLDHIRLTGTPVSPSPLPAGRYPDATDLPFAEVALAAHVSIVVSGNRAHFKFLSSHAIRVLSPPDFLDEL
jgi:putative PIN family toxin of toxin-antitoxin system